MPGCPKAKDLQSNHPYLGFESTLRHMPVYPYQGSQFLLPADAASNVIDLSGKESNEMKKSKRELVETEIFMFSWTE